jgi:hypothetical protein
MSFYVEGKGFRTDEPDPVVIIPVAEYQAMKKRIEFEDRWQEFDKGWYDDAPLWIGAEAFLRALKEAQEADIGRREPINSSTGRVAYVLRQAIEAMKAAKR